MSDARDLQHGFTDPEGNYFSPQNKEGFDGFHIGNNGDPSPLLAPYNKDRYIALNTAGNYPLTLKLLLKLEDTYPLEFCHDQVVLYHTGFGLLAECNQNFEAAMKYFQKLLELAETDKLIDGKLSCKKDLVREIGTLATLARQHSYLGLTEDQITQLHNLCIDHTQISPELDKSEPEDKRLVRILVRTNEALAAWELGIIFRDVGKYKEANDAFLRAYDGYKSHPHGASDLRVLLEHMVSLWDDYWEPIQETNVYRNELKLLTVEEAMGKAKSFFIDVCSIAMKSDIALHEVGSFFSHFEKAAAAAGRDPDALLNELLRNPLLDQQPPMPVLAFSNELKLLAMGKAKSLFIDVCSIAMKSGVALHEVGSSFSHFEKAAAQAGRDPDDLWNEFLRNPLLDQQPPVPVWAFTPPKP